MGERAERNSERSGCQSHCDDCGRQGSRGRPSRQGIEEGNGEEGQDEVTFTDRTCFIRELRGQFASVTLILLAASGWSTSAKGLDLFMMQASQAKVPSQEELLQRVARLVEQGNFSEAETPAREAVKISPGSAVAHNLLGIVLDQRGHSAEAEREYREAFPPHPKFSRSTHNPLNPFAHLHTLNP